MIVVSVHTSRRQLAELGKTGLERSQKLVEHGDAEGEERRGPKQGVQQAEAEGDDVSEALPHLHKLSNTPQCKGASRFSNSQYSSVLYSTVLYCAGPTTAKSVEVHSTQLGCYSWYSWLSTTSATYYTVVLTDSNTDFTKRRIQNKGGIPPPGKR